MKATEQKFDIVEPAIKHDRAQTRKVIVTIDLDFEVTAERSLNAIRKKGCVYKVGFVIIPVINDKIKLTEITGDLVYESWTRKRLQNFCNLRVDIREGIVITTEAYDKLVIILSRKTVDSELAGAVHLQ